MIDLTNARLELVEESRDALGTIVFHNRRYRLTLAAPLEVSVGIPEKVLLETHRRDLRKVQALFLRKALAAEVGRVVDAFVAALPEEP